MLAVAIASIDRSKILTCF